MIYRGKKVTFNEPIFFLISGISCLLGYFVLLLSIGSFDTSIFGFQKIELLRPPITFPINGIIQIFLFIGAFVGLILGPIGILWCLVSE